MQYCNKSAISCAIAIFALCSCTSGEGDAITTTGTINLNLEADKTITQSVVSRATVPYMPVLSSLTADKLTISLTNKSGSYSATWPSRNEFPADKDFPADTYTMTATFGNTNAEGFESPQLYGETTFPVVAGKSTSVSLTAKVANSLVMFEPTESFINYFQSVKIVLNSAEGNSLVVNPGETRPVYINPGNARIDARVVMPSGADALITIGYFTAKKATLHRVALDVEASTGTATLTVSFDDTFNDVEPIVIDLTKDLEDLVTPPEPVIIPEGFEGGVPVNLIETHSDGYAFNIAARSGLATATLSIADGDEAPDTYNLLDELDVKTLEQKGLRMLNLKKDCEFAKIYLEDFVAALRCKSRDAGSETKTITLAVTDRLGRTTDATLADNNTLKVNLAPVTFSVEAVKDIVVNPTYQVKAIYNGSNIKKWLKFHIVSNTGTDIPATPTKIENGDTENEYIFTFNTPLTTPYFNVFGDIGENISQQDEIFVPAFKAIAPDYDTWTTSAKLYINPDSAKYRDIIAENIRITGFENNQLQKSDDDPLTYKITGLTHNTQYTANVSLNGLNLSRCPFTTEEKLQLPNSGFETAAWSATKKGDYQYLWSISGWSTANETTISTYGSGSGNGTNTGGCAYKATSGTIPANSRSNYSNSYGGFWGTTTNADGHTEGNASLHTDKSHTGTNAALIRTVGYGSSNKAGAGTGNPASGFSTCQNVAAGELFIGTKDGDKYIG
ncbi:MAG: DUF4493 domain-containing protein, partial [Muribaculaceae bacterium]|nr:DUF4493 domain-containing protein [Muribaculaceae bacterium]